MKNIKLLKPQPSPKTAREPLTNITNCFHSRPKSDKQTLRSPSHSPVSSRLKEGRQTKRVLTPKGQTQTKYFQSFRCINHKEKQGKYKIEFDPTHCYYCQNCAVEIGQKGKNVVPLKGEDVSVKMIGQAKQYLKSLDEVMARLNFRRSEMRVERFKLESRYEGMQEDVQQERRSIISQINHKYDCQISKLLQMKRKQLVRIEEQQEKLVKFEGDFNTIRRDVSGNLNQINIHIQISQFRQIMNIYWEKLAKINERLTKPELNAVDSTQFFVNKYVPPIGQRQTFQETLQMLSPNPTGKQFTFSKNMNPKCKEVYSWELSNTNSDSSQSIVQEKIKLK